MGGDALHEHDFRGPRGGWVWPEGEVSWLNVTQEGAIVQAGRDEDSRLSGEGVHTRNGDRIELTFRVVERGDGALRFGFSGGMEHALVSLDLRRGRAELLTSDWTVPQPQVAAPLRLDLGRSYRLALVKSECRGGLLKRADITVLVDGAPLMAVENANVLPEMGVDFVLRGAKVLLQRFRQHGTPAGIPEYLHVGGWQMLNTPSIEGNLGSLRRGLRKAAAAGVELLVTPETSLTGLFPTGEVTRSEAPVQEAEARLRKFMAELPGAPYLVVGLPEWRPVAEHGLGRTRYNVSRVYEPDGHLLCSHAKVHSCETEFWHGYRLAEFDVHGVPTTMHICHDGRYPEVWTLPVMFGARLVLHPSNGGDHRASVDAFEAGASRSTGTSHAFYVHVNGGGGSYVAGPQKYDNVLAASPECRRDNADFPMCGAAREGLHHARIRVHDAFGYWPVRSYRTSEESAAAYLALYRALGGVRAPGV